MGVGSASVSLSLSLSLGEDDTMTDVPFRFSPLFADFSYVIAKHTF